MNDQNDQFSLTLKSFLAALTQLSEPLPADLQAQLRVMLSPDASLSNLGDALSALTRRHAKLREFYLQARAYLSLPAAQRSKSALFLPNDAAELHRPNDEIGNAYQDANPLLTEVEKGLNRLEKMSDDTARKQLGEIAQADDPVQAAIQAARDMMVPPSW